jgi:hypothetical protein
MGAITDHHAQGFYFNTQNTIIFFCHPPLMIPADVQMCGH